MIFLHCNCYLVCSLAFGVRTRLGVCCEPRFATQITAIQIPIYVYSMYHMLELCFSKFFVATVVQFARLFSFVLLSQNMLKFSSYSIWIGVLCIALACMYRQWSGSFVYGSDWMMVLRNSVYWTLSLVLAFFWVVPLNPTSQRQYIGKICWQ